MVGAIALFTLFDKHQLRKEVMLECKATFKCMMLARGCGMISLRICSPYSSYQNSLYDNIKGDKHHQVTCIKCSIDIKIYKLMTGFCQTILPPSMLPLKSLLKVCFELFFLHFLIQSFDHCPMFYGSFCGLIFWLLA